MTGRTDQQIEAAFASRSAVTTTTRSRLRRVAVAMLTIIAVIAAAGCLVSPFVPPRPPDANFVPQRTVLDSDEVRVPVSMSSSGLPFAMVTVGKTTAPFLIDSGCSGQILPASMAGDESLGALDARVGWTDNATHTATLSCMHAPSLIMGDVRFEDVDAIVWRDPNVPTGTLGWPAFMNVLLTIDYSDKTLILRHGELPPSDGNHILQIDNDGGNLLIPITLNGKPLRVCPDTGSEACLSLPKSQASSLKWQSPPVPDKTHNVLGDSNANVGQIDGEITIGGYTVRDPNVRVDDSQQFAIVGEQILGTFIVTFDFKNMRMELEPQPALIIVVFPSLTFQCDDHRKVTCVDAGGVADKAGIRVGDEIVSMNGQPNILIDTPNAAPPCIATITNWEVHEKGPLMMEIRREGHTLWIALPLKPVFPLTQPTDIK